MMQRYCSMPIAVCCVLVYLMHLVTLTFALQRTGIPPGGMAVPDKRLSELLYGHFGAGYHCLHNGRYVNHGHVFKTSTCLTSRCFFGTSFIHSEGCEDSAGACHEVDSVWTESCVSYRCHKTSKKGYNYYQPIVEEALCRDVYSKCHRPGETFSVRLDEVLHENCRCHIKDTMIYYRCLLPG